jgi:surfactin synthase thioesterase subunit
MEKINLFCLPYAGGTAMIYNRLKKYLGSSINLIPIELAGRGMRSKESFYESIEEAVEDIYSSIEDKLDGTKFAFLGHSMGTLLEYELIYKIYKLKNQMPIHAFFSGRHTPQAIKEKEDLYKLEDSDFIKVIYKIGGTPKGFFENEELVNMFIPILKADYKIVETYVHKEKKEKFKFDITIFNGKDDKDISISDSYEWENLTLKNCEVYIFDGGHFFILDKLKDIGEIISEKLEANRLVGC